MPGPEHTLTIAFLQSLAMVHDVHREHLLVVFKHNPIAAATTAAAVPAVVRGSHAAAMSMVASERDCLRIQAGHRSQLARGGVVRCEVR